MMNKIIIRVYIPSLELSYDIKVPINKKIYKITRLIVKAINEINGGFYTPNKLPLMYNKKTATPYNMELTFKDANIKNGTEIILL